MVKYSERQIRKLQNSHTRVSLYKPFPGKHPTRLFLSIKVYHESRKRWVKAFSYRGKFNSAILRKFYQIAENRENLDERISAEFVEYGPTCVVASGNASSLHLYRPHMFAHFLSPMHLGETVWRLGVGRDLPVVDEVPFQVNGRKIYVPASAVPKLGQVAELNSFRQTVLKYYRNREGL